MANTRTVSNQLQKEGLPLELVRDNSGYHYFIFDTLDRDANNRGYETHSVMCPRFGDLTEEQWLNEGRSFIRELEEKGLWPLVPVPPVEEPEPIDPTAPQEVTILAERLPEARQLLDKLIRKAQRYGSGEIAYTVGEVFHTEEVRTRWDGKREKVPGPDRVTLIVSGAFPVVGPFEFLAKVDHGQGGNILDIVPGQTVDRRFRSTASICEHCQTSRQRNETFIVRNRETGEELQVGRSCLADYLGRATPAGLTANFAFIRELREMSEDPSYTGWGAAYPVLEVLTLTHAAIRLWGWMSRGQAQTLHDGQDYMATASHVANVLSPPYKRDKHNEDIWERIDALKAAVGPEDEEEARRVLEWVEAGGAGDGDYGYNLRTAIGRGLIEPRRIDIVASAVSAKARADERELKLTLERQKAKASQWAGTEGERLRDLDLELVAQQYIRSGPFGDTILIKFRDTEGNLFSWFTSSGTGRHSGDRLKLDGTVKAHTEFKGAKETQLTRCKIK